MFYFCQTIEQEGSELPIYIHTEASSDEVSQVDVALWVGNYRDKC